MLACLRHQESRTAQPGGKARDSRQRSGDRGTGVPSRSGHICGGGGRAGPLSPQKQRRAAGGEAPLSHASLIAHESVSWSRQRSTRDISDNN